MAKVTVETGEAIFDKASEKRREEYVKVFFSVENRKKLAKEWGFDEQEMLDMSKKELHTLWCGINRGKQLAGEEIKNNFFCIPIDIYNHKLIEFNQVIQAAVDEMKEANNETTVNKEGSDGGSEHDRSEETVNKAEV